MVAVRLRRVLHCHESTTRPTPMTSAPDSRVQDDAAEQLLAALTGVVSAHVVTDEEGGMVEIHILATSDLHPKQVVRNVESALSAGLGIKIDRRIVSVAQVRSETSNGGRTGGGPAPEPDSASEPNSAAEPNSASEAYSASEPDSAQQPDSAPSRVAARSDPARLEYVRYEVRRGDERCTCSVVLRSGEQEVIGTGHGPDTVAGRAESAARAVLDAIGRARPELRLRLEGATLSQSGDRTFVIISAHQLLDRTTRPLAGAAALLRSPEEAAILAALQATNRCSG